MDLKKTEDLKSLLSKDTVGSSLKKDPEHVILLGRGQSWEQCPRDGAVNYQGRTVHAEVWGLNGLLYENIPLDRIFMMDILDEMPSVRSGLWDLKKTINLINAKGIPMVAPYKYEQIALSEAYPLQEVASRFGAPYLNNTIAFMIAYALLRGVKSISTWGINQASGSEYFYEKGCVEYWLGQALGRGVDVYINGPSELLINKARYGGNLLYGYNCTYEAWQKHAFRFGNRVVKDLFEPVNYKIPRVAGQHNDRGLAVKSLAKDIIEDGGDVSNQKIVTDGAEVVPA